MKIYITTDEWFPYYDATTEATVGHTVAEVTDVEWKQYIRLVKQLHLWQCKLADLVDESKRTEIASRVPNIATAIPF